MEHQFSTQRAAEERPLSVGSAQPATLRMPHGAGLPLGSRDRQRFEPLLGADFSLVRVHSDAGVVKSVGGMPVAGYAAGHDIVMPAGHYPASSQLDVLLLVHELAHIAQFTGAGKATASQPMTRSEFEGRALEREAMLATVSTALDRRYPVTGRTAAYEPQPLGEAALSWIDAQVARGGRAAIEAVIAWLRSEHQSVISGLRARCAGLGPADRPLAERAVTALDVIFDVLQSLSIAITGLLKGFVSGVISMVTGLVRLLLGLCDGLARMIIAPLDHGAAARQWWHDVAAAMDRMVPALKTFVHNWTAEFARADTDHQTAMIAEVFGQILALLASLGVGGAAAGSAPSMTLRIPQRALAFAGEASAELAVSVPVNVATPVIGTALGGTAMLRVTSNGGGGGGGGSSGRPRRSADPAHATEPEIDRALQPLDEAAAEPGSPLQQPVGLLDIEGIVNSTMQSLRAELGSRWLSSAQFGTRLHALVARRLAAAGIRGAEIFVETPLRAIANLRTTANLTVQSWLRARPHLAWIEGSLNSRVLTQTLADIKPDLVVRAGRQTFVWDLTSVGNEEHLAKTVLYTNVLAEDGQLVQISETYWRTTRLR